MYIRNLLRELSETDTENGYFVFLHPSAVDLVGNGNPRWRPILEKLMGYVPNSSARTVQNQYRRVFLDRRSDNVFSVEEAAFDKDIQIWFCPLVDFRPTNIHVPSVINIPDILQDIHPDYFSNKDLMIRAETYQPSAERATAIITYSEFSRRSIIEAYGVSPEKIFVIPPGAGRGFRASPAAADANIREEYDLPKEYAYYPAHGWAHKNHRRLVEAFARFRERRGESSLHLVLSGALWDREEELKEVIRINGLRDRVVVLGYVDAAQVPLIMRGSKFMIFPSLFEGGAIPVIEAMSIGCPVATSDSACMPEIAGAAALYFDPEDVDDMAAAIESMDSDGGLRAEKAAAGSIRAKAYSCAKNARKHLQVFKWALDNFKDDTSSKQVVLSLSDGWMEQESSIEFRFPDLSHIEMTMHIPEGLPLDDTCINIAAFGLSFHIRCSSGEKKVVEIVPPKQPRNGKVSIEFRADKYFCIKDLGWGNDKRRLSFRIEELRAFRKCGEAVSILPLIRE